MCSLMAITLGNNLIQHSTLNRINHTSNNLARQISSGTKHPSAVFGPSAYAIDMRMNANIAAVSQDSLRMPIRSARMPCSRRRKAA